MRQLQEALAIREHERGRGAVMDVGGVDHAMDEIPWLPVSKRRFHLLFFYPQRGRGEARFRGFMPWLATNPARDEASRPCALRVAINRMGLLANQGTSPHL